MNLNIRSAIDNALKKIGIETANFIVEHPDDLLNGDYSTNIALVVSKELKKNPRELAEEIAQNLRGEKLQYIEKIEVAGAGFINFYLTKDFFTNSTSKIVTRDNFGKGDTLSGKEILFEYTDPNPFKQFHIGHLMSNALGEALSRLAEWQGARVRRLCYGGDVGLHVAKAIWGMIKARIAFPQDGDSLADKIKFLGDSYVSGSNAYEDDDGATKEIKEINKKIFNHSDPELEIYYQKGKKWSEEHFKEIYLKLNTIFDKSYYESEIASIGVQLVKENIGKIFEESDNAIVFKGEEYGLHTRVFLTSEELPTYETKELGLNRKKSIDYPDYDSSFVVTATEQNDYFKVIEKVFEFVDPHLAKKFTHLSHGMMRFAEGKMSSRKGNIITGESLIKDMESLVEEKIKERDLTQDEKNKIVSSVAVSAIKHGILRQSPGKDIIFDKEKALSFEGDSGPYLQYAYVRTNSIMEKLPKEFDVSKISISDDWQTIKLEKLLYRFPEILSRAWFEKAPQLVVDFLGDVAGAFNSFYADSKIIDENNPDSSYRVAITKAVGIVLKNGLEVLGIAPLNRM